MQTVLNTNSTGLALRENFIQGLFENLSPVDFIEVVSENYMFTNDANLELLKEFSRKYPLALHGVSLNIGADEPLNLEYLTELKRIVDTIKPIFISDHICFTGIQNFNSHDLLPMPYTQESLELVSKKINQAQDFLEREISFENPSTYVEYSINSMPEYEFFTQLAENTACKMLLDINNVYVSANNHGFCPRKYLNNYPCEKINYMHIAGHTRFTTHIVDTHGENIAQDVFNLYSWFIENYGNSPTILERDNNIPTFEIIIQEIKQIKKIQNTYHNKQAININQEP